MPDSVTLNAGAVVDGEVFVGVDGNVDTVIKDLGATTDGKYSLAEEIVFPPVSPPVGLPPGQAIVYGGDDNCTVSVSGVYNNVAAGQGRTLTINGDVTIYVTGNISLGQASEVIITPNSSLTVYLDGDLIANQSNGINNETLIPANFKLFTTGTGVQDIIFKNSGAFYGAVYAPNADIRIDNGAGVYGSFVGTNFIMRNSGLFRYDEALRDISINDEGVQFVIERWSEE